MNKRYFRLFPHCELVLGPRRAVVYDLGRGQWFHLDELQSSILGQCERNIPVKEITRATPEQVERTLEEVTQLRLGMPYDGPLYVEKMKLSSSFELPGLLEPPPILARAYLQITTECNLACKFCDQSAFIPWLGCNACIRWPSVASRQFIDPASLDQVIDGLMALEVMNLQLSGGNPLLHADIIQRVVERVRGQERFSVGITVQTNGTGLSNDFLHYAVERGIGFSFSVFGESPGDYQQVCGNAAAFDEIHAAIRKCQEQTIPFTICVVLTPDDSVPWTARKEAALALGGREVFFTELVTEKNGKIPPVSPVPVNEPREKQFAREYFFFHKRCNVCLFGILAVDVHSGLRPCPMIADRLGDLNQESLHSLIRQEKLKSYWHYTKNQVPVCRDCEFHHLCADCTLLERLTENRPEFRSAICGYDPDTGRWPSATDSPLVAEF